jgi:predicted enzyme related to lactoylglutathione lyase
MGERTSYAPGTFSWAELVTSDAGAAKAFYTALFGWSYDDQPIGDGSVYSMAARDGSAVAALYGSDEQPPHWNCYVTVASADETAAKVAALGGTVIAEPFDVFTSGRMAVLSDPTGGVVSVWEAKEHIGASLVNTAGALAWNDLVTPDPDAASAFYGELFGWSYQDVGGGYRVIANGGRSNGGMLKQDGPAAWLPYFAHEDVDAAIAQVQELGGQLFNGPLQVPNGRFAVLSDPQGAVFAVLVSDNYDD